MIGDRWSGYVSETDWFSEPEEAIERYEMSTGDILTLEEVEVRVVHVRTWVVQKDGSLLEKLDL